MALRFGLGLGLIPDSARPAVTTAPVNEVAPSVAGILTQGQTVTVMPGSWTGLPSGVFLFQRIRLGTPIGSPQSSPDFPLISADVGTNTVEFDVTATNSVGSTTVRTSPISVAAPLTISGSPPGGTVGVSYGFTPSTAGGHAPKTFALTGTLPAGLSFNTSTGAISGTPTASSTATGLNITVTDADGLTASLGVFSISVVNAGPSLNISGVAPADTTWDLTDLATITVSGAGAGYTVEVVDGSGNPVAGFVVSPET
jgi:hypothetical protein